MKKLFLLVTVAAAMASCIKDGSIAPASREQMEMTVSVGIDTRATYDASLKAQWQAGDAIAVAQSCKGAAKSTLTMVTDTNSNASGVATATFKGSVTYIANSSQYYNYGYPVGDFSFANGETTFTHTVAAAQSNLKWEPALYVSSADKMDETTAKSQSITFGKAKNALLSVRVMGDSKSDPIVYKTDITTITIAPAGEGLCGNITNTAQAYGKFSTEAINREAGKNITATFDDTYVPENGNEYRIDVLPAAAKVVTVTVTDKDGTEKVLTSKNEVTFNAGSFTTATVDWTAQTIEFEVTASFSDAENGGEIL